MKNIKLLLFSFLILIGSIVSVNAQDVSLVQTSSSLNTLSGTTNIFEHYSYNNTQIYRTGEELYFYSNVINNAKKTRPICLEVLLFDKDEKNIGIFNYSSEKDYETQYASKRLQSGESISFNYKIIDKYLADKENNKLSDVYYFSIINENEYCKVGGYSNYSGQKFNEIISSKNEVTEGTKFDSIVSFINKYIPIHKVNVGFGISIVIVIVVLIAFIAIWVLYGKFLNKLHNAMYKTTTALAYVPIANNYLCVKMAFGKIIGLSYLGVVLLGSLIGLIGFGFISIIANLALIVAFVLDIVKLVTSKYDLCYLDTSKNNVIVNNFDNVNNNVQNQTNEYGYSQDSNVKESLIGVSSSNTLDDDISNVNDNNNNIINNNVNNNDDNSGESDLSKFFR